jgi:hypothetical protein
MGVSAALGAVIAVIVTVIKTTLDATPDVTILTAVNITSPEIVLFLK